MKYRFSILACFIGIHVFAKSRVYVNEPKNSEGSIVKWMLTLHDDGTFLYYFLRDFSDKVMKQSLLFYESKVIKA